MRDRATTLLVIVGTNVNRGNSDHGFVRRELEFVKAKSHEKVRQCYYMMYTAVARAYCAKWITGNVLYVPTRSKYLRELSQLNRAQSYPNGWRLHPTSHISVVNFSRMCSKDIGRHPYLC